MILIKLYLALLLWFEFWLESVQFQVSEKGITRQKQQQSSDNCVHVGNYCLVGSCSWTPAVIWLNSHEPQVRQGLNALEPDLCSLLCTLYTHITAFIRWAFSHPTGRFVHSSVPWTLSGLSRSAQTAVITLGLPRFESCLIGRKSKMLCRWRPWKSMPNIWRFCDFLATA